MDSNLAADLDFFAASNSNSNTNQNLDGLTGNGEGPSSSSNAADPPATQRRESSLWNAALGTDGGVSDSVSNGPSGSNLTSYVQPPTAPTDFDFGSLASPYDQSKPSAFTAERSQSVAEPSRKRDGNARKRTKLNSDLESADYWIQYDDDDPERTLGESFEIDFSKRRSAAWQQRRPLNAVNPLSTTPGLGTGLYATSSLKVDDFLDDSALDNALSDDEDVLESINLSDHLSKIDSAPPTEVPPREGLYSTPLSWEKPQPGLRMDPLLGIGGVANLGSIGSLGSLGGGVPIAGFAAPIMDEAEQRRLLAIAMNTSRTPSGFSSFGLPLSAGFGSGFSTGFDVDLEAGYDAASFSPVSRKADKGTAKSSSESKATSDCDAKSMPPPPRPSMQRTNSGATDKSKEKEKAKLPVGDRTAHNDIERKYRTNLKDRIAELRDAVPALRSLPEEGEESASQRALKVSKGTVLTKATEYIHYLERRNKAIIKEHQELARRLQAFEQLLNATARQPFLMPNHSRTLFDPRGFC